MANENSKEYENLVKRRHPVYAAHIDHWNFVEQCYEGGREWFKDNIFRYFKEGDKEYAERVDRAYRFNHSREVVDLVNKYIFKMEITRNLDDAPEFIKKYWESSTRNKKSIDLHAREFSLRSSIYGRAWVVIDSTAQFQNSAIVSKADEKSLDVKVYSYIVKPQSILDFSRDDSGELNWILIHESVRDDANPLTSSGAMVNRYRLWDREEWYLFEEKKVGDKIEVDIVELGTHNLGEVPVVEVDNSFSEDDYIPSLIADIAYLDRAVANYLSNLDAIIQDQTFSQLAMPAQSVVEGDENHSKMMEVGTKRVFTYDGSDGGKPFFLSPDVKQAQLILSAMRKS